MSQWQQTGGADKKQVKFKRYTYTLITGSVNTARSQIHNDGDNAGRMPLFLHTELAKKWVQVDLSLTEYQAILDDELPDDQLNYRSVYTEVPKNAPIIRGRMKIL